METKNEAAVALGKLKRGKKEVKSEKKTQSNLINIEKALEKRLGKGWRERRDKKLKE